MLCLLAFKTDNTSWKTCTISEIDGEIKKMEAFYKSNTSYSVLITHSSFIGHNAITPFEKSEGFLIKHGTNLHSMILGIETIQNDKWKVVIDSSSNTIAVSDIEKEIQNQALPLNALLAKKNITVCKKADLQGSDKLFHIEFSAPVKLLAEEMKIGADYRLKELTMLYREKYNVDPENANSPKEQPKVTIVLKDYKLNPKIDIKKEFNTNTYFVVDKAGNFVLTPVFKQYEILDLRISKNIK